MSQLAMPPTGATYFLGDEALTLFLEYRYLPADQLARILSAVAGLNQAVLTAIRDFQWQQGDLRLRPELYITSVRTGESIEIKFRPGIFVFSVKFTKDGDVRIELPQWSVAGFLAAQLFHFAATNVSDWDKIMSHLSQHAQEQVQHYIDPNEIMNPETPAGRDIRFHLAAFEREIESPNILSVRVNEAIIRKREEEEEPPSRPPAAG